MIIWSGRGIVIFVIGFACVFLTGLGFNAIMQDNRFYQNHWWARLLGFWIAAAISWPVGRAMNRGTDHLMIDPKSGQSEGEHSLFYIPVQDWWVVFLGLGVLATFVWPQGAEPQAVTPKGPDNPNLAAPKPPDRFPPTPEENARLDPSVSGLVGQWTNQAEGLTVVWTIRSTAGKWEVSGLFFDGAKEVGSFVGLDVQMSGQTLSFVTQFVRQPPRPWLSGAIVAVKLDGGKLTFTWQLGGSSGTQTMVRVER